MFNKINNFSIYAITILGSQVSLLADEVAWSEALTKQTNAFKPLLGTEGDAKSGAFYYVIISIILLIGVIMFSMGIHESFIKEDRGGEGQKSKGLLKIIGGSLFIGLGGIVKSLSVMHT